MRCAEDKGWVLCTQGIRWIHSETGSRSIPPVPYVSWHDKSLLKQIAKGVADESEESELEDDWYSSSSGDEFDDEED